MHIHFFWALILHLSWLSSVTNFSGISQCANQQEEGQQNWTSNDQGQLHLRSLILCSLASAPLLLTAHIFPVEWKGAVGVENDSFVISQSECILFGKSVLLNAKEILWWKKLSFVVVDLFTITCCNYIPSSLNNNLFTPKRTWVSLVPQNKCKFKLFYFTCCVTRLPSLESMQLP